MPPLPVGHVRTLLGARQETSSAQIRLRGVYRAESVQPLGLFLPNPMVTVGL